MVRECKCRSCSLASEPMDMILKCEKNHFEECMPSKAECSLCTGLKSCVDWLPKLISPNHWECQINYQ